MRSKLCLCYLLIFVTSFYFCNIPQFHWEEINKIHIPSAGLSAFPRIFGFPYIFRRIHRNPKYRFVVNLIHLYFLSFSSITLIVFIHVVHGVPPYTSTARLLCISFRLILLSFLVEWFFNIWFLGGVTFCAMGRPNGFHDPLFVGFSSWRKFLSCRCFA